MEQQDAESKFKKLEKYIPFLETFCNKNKFTNTKNEFAAKRFEKAQILLNMLKVGYKGYAFSFDWSLLSL